MLPLDHIPFPGPDLAATAVAFAALGFNVSPRCAYTSPDEPGARWDNHCVFLDKGWFDLLQAHGAPQPVRPGGALFLTDDLDAASARLSPMRQLPPYRLIRCWDDAPGRGQEDFAMFAVRERISPLGLAVIQHHYPCLDASPAWFVHPNSAKEVAGVAFAGAEPGPFAQAAAEALDLSGFEYWEQAEFSDAFGEGVDCAVRVRVSSLAAARASLSPSLAVVESKGRLHVTPPSPLGCGFLFFES